MEKNLKNINTEDAKANVSDVQIVGNPDLWQLLCKAYSYKEGWMKSTKAMELFNGCLVQVTTQQRNGSDNSYTIAEALTFVPEVGIITESNGNKKLARR